MNKKIFIKNRPFDLDDAADLQNWTEESLKTTMKTIYTSGIVTGLDITPKSNLSLNLNIGYAFDSNYDIINVTSVQSVTLSTASSTNPRIDLIVIKPKKVVQNNVDTTNKYGIGTSYIYSQNEIDSFEIITVTGTPAASPAVPSAPAGSLSLASVYVNKSATSIVSGNITDLRKFLTINQNINQPEVIIGKNQPANINVLWIDMN